MEENRTKEFEDTFHKDLATYLEAHDLIDKHFPEAPDIEALWATIGESYLPDAMRELGDVYRYGHRLLLG